MKRQAIIIGNNVGHGAATFLKGVTYDLCNYYTYLTSDIGGAWLDGEEGEILILHNAGKKKIKSAIRECDADYSFVVFSGHGFYSSDDNKTYICVDDGYLSEDELDTGIEKQTLIFDCCREVEGITEGFTGLFGDITKAENIAPLFQSRNIRFARHKFDSALTESSVGQYRGYACLIDQTSADNPTSGGLFSTALISAGINFGSRDRAAFWLPIRKAMKEAIRILINDPFTDQVPTYITIPQNMKLTHPFALTNRIKSLNG